MVIVGPIHYNTWIILKLYENSVEIKIYTVKCKFAYIS